MAKALLKEMTLRSGLSQTHQSDNGQLLFHRSPRRSFRPWELNVVYIQLGDLNSLEGRKSQSVKQTLVKLCQETFRKWIQCLPIALLRISNTPRAKIHLSPLEMLYWRPFLSNDLVEDPETDNLLRYIID